MVDKKIDRPVAPVEWDLPNEPDDLGGPDKSFHDDHVGGRLKADEAAIKRLATDLFSVEQGKAIVTRHEKIEEAAAFLPTQPEDQQARQARAQQQPRDTRAQHSPSSIVERQGSESEGLERVEQRLESLFGHLRTLDEEHAAAGQRGGELVLEPGTKPPLHQLENRMMRLELQLKQQFVQLLAGGLGFRLLDDPRLTFRHLFDRMGRWPRRVRPGRRPETDEEFDAFLTWVFEPPAPPEDAQSVERW